MPKVRYKKVNLKKLKNAPGHTVILRLIMALNDIASVQNLLSKLKGEMPETQEMKEVRKGQSNFDKLKQSALQGHVRYLERMQVGHLREAKKVLDEISSNSELERTFKLYLSSQDKLWNSTWTLFNDIKFRTHIKKVRDNLGFHYNNENGSKILIEALERGIKAGHNSQIVFSDDPAYMRASLGDDIYDYALSNLLNVPSGKDFHSVFYQELGYHFDLAKAFVNFASSFLKFHFEKYELHR
jgi:hypothetical protein